MTKNLEHIDAYLKEHWITADERRPYVMQINGSTALFHKGYQGILAVTSQSVDLDAVRLRIPPDIKVTTLFYGDGKTFFRNAHDELVKKIKRRRHTGSLWEYAPIEIERGLLLHRLERDEANKGEVFYFHTKPEFSQDVIAGYSLKPFVFDYTHHPNVPGVNREESRLYFSWKNGGHDSQRFVMGSFVLDNGSFVEKKRPKLEFNLG